MVLAGGRTGVRDEAQAQAVLDEIARWPDAVALVGVGLAIWPAMSRTALLLVRLPKVSKPLTCQATICAATGV